MRESQTCELCAPCVDGSRRAWGPGVAGLAGLRFQTEDAVDLLNGERYFQHIRSAEIKDLSPQRFIGKSGYNDQSEAWSGVLPFQQVTPRPPAFNLGITDNQPRVELVDHRLGAGQVGDIHHQPTGVVEDFPKCARILRRCRDEYDHCTFRYCPYEIPMNRFSGLRHVGPRAQWRATLAFVAVFFSSHAPGRHSAMISAVQQNIST